jgi:site-specific recombinase XerD
MLNYFCQDVCDSITGTTFGDRLADSLSKTEIENWLNAKALTRDWSDNKWSDKSKANYRGAIRAAYREAMRLDLITFDPTELIVYKVQPEKEVRNVVPQELDLIRASIAIPGNSRRKPAFCRKCLAQLEIALQTGMRKEEQFSATWEKIDWKRQVLFIPKSKNRQQRYVYLNSYAIAILRALQDDQTRNGVLPSGRIFGISNPREWFERTLAHAQIDGVSWHTLRHHFATHLASVNIHPRYIQELMGHIDWRSAARYIHPSDKEAVAGVASLVDGSVPEYLLNRSYIQAMLDNEADLDVIPAPEPFTEVREHPQASPVEAPSGKLELPPRMLTRIPREELYDLVWSKPMIHAAQQLRRSDVAVAKACRKLNIPVPPQGYWNKLTAGKPVPSRPSLPSLPNNPQ